MGNPKINGWAVVLLRSFTPLLLLFLTWTGKLVVDKINTMNTNLQNQLSVIDDRFYKHQTNEEIHIPRSQVVSDAEFKSHCRWAEEYRQNMRESIAELKTVIREEIKNNSNFRNN